MKSGALTVVLLAMAMFAPAQSTMGAMDKVFQMLADLEAKIMAQAVEAKTVFDKFSANCKSQSQEYGFEIKTSQTQIEELSATMTKETSTITTSSSKIDTLSGSITSVEQELAAATKVRKSEAATYATEEKELLQTIDTIERAISVLSRELGPQPVGPGGLPPQPMVQPVGPGGLPPAIDGGPDVLPPQPVGPGGLPPPIVGPGGLPPAIDGGPDTIPPHLRASMLQTQSAQNLVQAFTAMVQASMLTQADATRLTSLTQEYQQDGESDGDEDLGAPAGAVYESRSGGIIEVLEGLLEKAQAQLDSARKAEATSVHNFQMLVQSLKDEIKYSNEDMSKVKMTLHKSKETFSMSKGDLSVTKKDLSTTMSMLKELEHNCMATAGEYEEQKKSRAEELAAVRKATQIIKEATSFVDKGTSNAISFMQVKRTKIASGSDSVNVKAVHLVRSLARKEHSSVLSQLASKMDSIVKMSAAAGADPFSKIKGLISGMIQRLEEEASAEADHKAYCDKELGETTAKKDASTSEMKSMAVNLDQMKAHVMKLKEEIADLEKELAVSSKAAAEAGVIRQEEHAEFEKNVAEYSKGLEGVKLALKVLREYYAKEKAKAPESGIDGGPGVLPPQPVGPGGLPPQPLGPGGLPPAIDGGPDVLPPQPLGPGGLPPPIVGPGGLPPAIDGGPDTIPPHLRVDGGAAMLQASPNSGAASGIISLLEVIESDLSKGLVEFKQGENSAASEYEEMMKSMKMSTTTKQQDVKYKTKEVASLEKKIADVEGDLANAETELDAVMDYLDKLNKECAAKVEPYEERKARREAEIDGLKEALTVLEGETALIQRKVVRRRALRGVQIHNL